MFLEYLETVHVNHKTSWKKYSPVALTIYFVEKKNPVMKRDNLIRYFSLLS